MAMDTSGITGAKNRGIGKGFFNKSGKLKSKTKLKKEKAAQASSQSKNKTTDKAQFSKNTTEAFKSVKSDIRLQANEIYSLVNEKTTLIDSALSVNQQQIESIRKLQTLIKEEVPDEEINAERSNFINLQQISEELELEIASHNIESRNDQYQSIRAGNKTEATFKLEAVEYRAPEGDTSSLGSINEAIASLKQNRSSLNEQKQDFKDLRSAAREVSKSAIEEIQSFSDTAIDSLIEAQQAAADIAEQISIGSFNFLETHSGLTASDSILSTLFEDEIN